MAAIRNILNVYEKADSAKKVVIIIRYYPNFLGIVDSYTEGLRYMIENEKAYNRSKNIIPSIYTVVQKLHYYGDSLRSLCMRKKGGRYGKVSKVS